MLRLPVHCQVMGPYYAEDHRNVFLALWDCPRHCPHVEPEVPGSGILWYPSAKKDVKKE